MSKGVGRSVGRIMRARRLELDLTLDQLAKRVGVTKGYLSLIENEKMPNPPSDGVLGELERALKFTDSELRRAGEWQNTPPRMRARLEHAVEAARRGRELARWLSEAPRRKGGGKSLDKLFSSGELARRIDEALGDKRRKPRTGPVDGSDVEEFVPLRCEVPLINNVAAGYPSNFTDLDYPARVADDYVTCPDLNDQHAFAARVVGDSMLPEYREGDIVVFSPAAKVVDGSDCFVRLEPDHESTFKRVFFDPADKNLIRLQPLNPAFAPRTVQREHVAGMYAAVWRMQSVGK